MSPDDLRHGSYAGVSAHYRDREAPCAACLKARTRRQKQRRLQRMRGVPAFATHGQLQAVLAPWLRMGMSPTSIYRAAGLAPTYGGSAYSTGRGATVETFDALARIVEADFLDTEMVYTDLTRRRIYSLRAIGHRLRDMPVDERGVWRTHERVTIGQARAMRDHYRANEFQVGESRNSESRARNAGHLPPLAWDDPDTLAWPDGPEDWYVPRERGLDPVVVMRLLEGERITSTRAEKEAAVAEWVAQGGSERELCMWHGWKGGRYTAALRLIEGGAA